MRNAEEFGYIKQAQSELNQRITQTNKICNQFKNSYSEYSSIIKQIFLLVLFGIPVSMLIWTVLNINVILNIFSTQDYGRDSLLLKVSLAGIGLYIALHMYRKIIHILRIFRINGHIFRVRNIEKRLQKNLTNLGNIAAEADRQIWSSTNEKIDPKDDIDAEITKYSNIARIYSNPDDNALSVILTITHWLSGILFASVLLLISTSFFAEKIGEWINIKEYSLVSFVYIAGFMILYMIVQEFFAKNSIMDIHIKIKNIMGFLLKIGICGILVYIISGQGREYLFGNSMQVHRLGDKEYTFARIFSSFIQNQTGSNYSGFIRSMSMPYIPLAICMIFLSMICFICKIEKRILNIIGIIFSIGILIILLYLIFGLKFISFVDETSKPLSTGVVSMMFLMYVPLMTAAFFASIISILSRIRSAAFGTIVVGFGVLYTFICFIIQLTYNSKISCALIGDIIVWAILLAILAVSAAIALLPSMIVLFIAASISRINQKYDSDDDKDIIVAFGGPVLSGSSGFLLGSLIGAIAAPVLYALAAIIEFLSCFFTCGQKGGGFGGSVIPIWNGTYFSNTVVFCIIAVSIIGTIYGIAKYIQEN